MLQNIRQAQTGIAERREEARQNNRKAAEAGFTLIELLIVIVILGILAAVVVFSVRGIQDKGVEAACKADVTSVVTASEAYYAQNGKYATAIDGTADTTLVGSGLLHAAPASSNYTIALDSGTGKVTVTGAAGVDIGSCANVADNAPAPAGG